MKTIKNLKTGDGEICKKCENMKGGCKWAYSAALTEYKNGMGELVSSCTQYEMRKMP